LTGPVMQGRHSSAVAAKPMLEQYLALPTPP
jgi:hypothetical protein